MDACDRGWFADILALSVMRRRLSTFQALAGIAAIALFSGAQPRAVQGPTLERLKGVEELKSWFNAGAGHARLIFLLSPT